MGWIGLDGRQIYTSTGAFDLNADQLVLLVVEQEEAFFNTYPFHIKPATDDKPYFANFFRWGALKHLIKTLGKEWLPFAEHGYLVLLATFFQAGLWGVLLIILPMWFAFKKKAAADVSFKPATWVYFMNLGFSYMLLEIALVQKFNLFLHHPIYSASVVIAIFLLISGIGSFLSHKFLQKGSVFQIIPFVAIISLGIFYAFALDVMFAIFYWANLPLRLFITFLIISPLAFFLGMPFPFGLQKIVGTGEKNVGGAWGYNGFFSVIGAVSTPILAHYLGFQIVAIIGSLGYLSALLLWKKTE